MTSTTTARDTAPAGFAARLREGTRGDHGSAETSATMRALVTGRIDRAGLAWVLAQHLPVYRALEEVADDLAADPVVAPFLVEGLARTAVLEADLARLRGPEGTPAAGPAALGYAARIEATRGWPAGFVAHHYTRYLGDLSGGQHIGRALARAHPELELGFYTFVGIDPVEVKDAYRAALDAAPWDDDEQAAVLAEVRVAYELSARLVADPSPA
ncbi:biliverdin-producing heme oxygenase [Iamia majanohamensis]|uniref:Biliverdin-producing heme oxygenase n=1 Tax=Iamia majanohamensis TaxID=467976 RepID=A0AAE9YGW1_9ACTN|nr:biliverdin-producing heme oxygenase [Iamia majanohamensis]WCO68252.1 biliverdin-producing heme oxygenase [Iamia majanohamensis]